MSFRKFFRTPALALVIGIPIASVVAGAAMLYLAISSADPQGSEIARDQVPMSKTSWRGKRP